MTLAAAVLVASTCLSTRPADTDTLRWECKDGGWVPIVVAVTAPPLLRQTPDCFTSPYSNTCFDEQPWRPAESFQANRCYVGAYPEFILRVNATGESYTRRGVTMIWGEWIGQSASGPVSFYQDSPPMPFTEKECPTESRR